MLKRDEANCIQFYVSRLQKEINKPIIWLCKRIIRIQLCITNYVYK